MANEAEKTDFKVKDRVAKRGGDYVFFGVVIGVFPKRNNRTILYAVENDDGVVRNLKANQLEMWTSE
jgi:hypothetical protein